jgi:hypothetical protein
MKTTTLALTFIIALLMSAVAGTRFVNLGKANPSAWTYKGEIPPPANANPPTVTIFSPESTAYATDTVNLTFHVRSFGLPLYKVYYITDWQENNVIVYDLSQPPENPYAIRPIITQFPYNITLTGVPEGKHNITVYAVEQGQSSDTQDPLAYYYYFINDSATVSFAIGTTFDITSTTLVIAPIASATAIGVGLLVYFKKRKH